MPNWSCAALVVLLGAACAPGTPASTLTRDELRGGATDDGGFPEVFMVRMRFDTGDQFVCSATLVTSRTLLTAAHCFDPHAAPNATALTDVWVQDATFAPDAASSTWLRIDPAHTRIHPQWNVSDRLSWDLAAALLPAPSGVTPAPPSLRALTTADVGSPLTVVGFGITSAGATDYGVRRVTTLPITSLSAQHLGLGDGVSKGICNGDSGGPSFLTGRDGRHRVAGVHSYDSSLACDDGLDSRVDVFADFLTGFIVDEEGGPTCFEDGLCKPGCTPVDVDCACQADGVCTAACPDLLTDPDCPADCAANGVCLRDCPVPDPDCPPVLGDPCVIDLTVCPDGSTCTALAGQPTVCAIPCAGPSSCASGSCVDGQNHARVCGPANVTGSCSSTATGPLLVLALWVGCRRRRW